MTRNYGLCVDCVLNWFDLIMGNTNGVILEHVIVGFDLEMRLLVVCALYATLVVL